MGIYNNSWLWTDKKSELKILFMNPGNNPVGFIIYDDVYVIMNQTARTEKKSSKLTAADLCKNAPGFITFLGAFAV